MSMTCSALHWHGATSVLGQPAPAFRLQGTSTSTGFGVISAGSSARLGTEQSHQNRLLRAEGSATAVQGCNAVVQEIAAQGEDAQASRRRVLKPSGRGRWSESEREEREKDARRCQGAQALQARAGLSSAQVAELAKAAPAVLLGTPPDKLVACVEQLVALGVHKSAVCKVLGRSARLVRENAEPWELGRGVRAVCQELGFSREADGELDPKMRTAVGKMVARFPDILSISIDKVAAAKQFLQGLGLTETDVRYIAVKAPTLLASSTLDLQMRVDFFTEQLGMDGPRLAHLILKAPTCLRMAVTTLTSKLEFFESLGIPRAEMANFIHRFPSLLVLSLEKNLIPSLEVLKEELKLQEQEPLARLLLTYPAALAYRRERIRENIGFLKSIGLQAEGDNSVIIRHPSLLGYSVSKNLAPKVEFFRNHIHADVTRISEHPAFLGYSLEARIRPRMAFLNSRGIPWRNFVMFMYTDAAYCKKVVKCHPKDYDDFREKYKGKLLAGVLLKVLSTHSVQSSVTSPGTGQVLNEDRFTSE